MPNPRNWGIRTNPPVVPPFTTTGTLDPAIAPLDEMFRRFMQANLVRASTLAVVEKGIVRGHRGYTAAAAGYPITQPDSVFRLASLSKILTCAAITHLENTGRLSGTTRAFPFLGITHPRTGMSRQPGMDQITVSELVNHRACLQDGIDNREIAHTLSMAVPPKRRDIVEYVYGLPRLRPPDGPLEHRAHYSNFGYVVLTSIVEGASPPSTFLSFLHREILTPMGLSALWMGRTTKLGALPNEVSYDAEWTGPSQLDPVHDTQEPAAYGGTCILENSEGAGGLVSTSLTIARLISRYAVWDGGPRVLGRRDGSFAGTWGCAQSLSNDIDVVFLFNRDVPTTTKNAFAEEVARFLNP